MDKLEVPDRGSPSRSVSGPNKASVCEETGSPFGRAAEEPRSGTLSMPLLDLRGNGAFAGPTCRARLPQLSSKKPKPNRKPQNLQDVKEDTKLFMAHPAKQYPSRKWAFRLAGLAVPLLFLMLLEAGLRLIGFGYPTSFFLKGLAGGRDVYVENPKVTWRYFSPGLARAPQSTQIDAVKPAETYRIFVMGESAAMGDPEPAFGFGRILETLLRPRYPGKKFEVVNVAITAINSHVIRQIAHDCAPRQGDLWIIYMGNNEVVGPFGAGTIFGTQAPNLSFIRASIALKQSRVVQLLDGFRRHLKSGEPAEWGGMEMFLNQQISRDNPRMEVVYHHFQKNLEAILDMAAASGARVLLSTVASNLKDCPPFASLHRPGLTDLQRAEWDRLYQAGISADKTANTAEALAQYEKALAIDEQYAELLFRIGRCQSALGESAEARQSFEKARDLDTLRFRADTRLNELIRQVANTRSRDQLTLVDAVDTVAKASPGQIVGEDFFYEHVHFNFPGNYLIARTFLSQLEDAGWPGLPGATKVAGDVLSREECAKRLACTDWDRYQILDEMATRLQQPPFTTQLDRQARDARLEQARTLLHPAVVGEGLRQAAEIYQFALGKAPGDWVLHENFAKLLQSSGDPRGAEEQWRKVIELMPHNEQAYYSLGNVLDGEGKSAEALAYFQQALRRKPDSFEAHNGLGLALANQGKAAEAMREYETALRRNPRFAEARVNMGQILAAQGNVEQAKAQYEMSLRANSNNVAAHINLGKLLAKENQLDAAIAHYQAALRLKPDHAIAHYNLGNALASQGRVEDSIAQFTEAVRLQPDFAEARHNLGLGLAKHGRSAEALEQFSEAVRLKPDFAEAHLNLGVALAKEHKFDQAIQQFQETLRLDPGNAAARKFLDQAVALQGGKR